MKQKDFSRVPTREVARKIQAWNAMEGTPKAEKAYLNANADLKAWKVSELKHEAKTSGIAEQFHETYAKYYTTSFSGYEDEWFKMENRPFYEEMKRVGKWKGQDFSAVPSRAVATALKAYEAITGANADQRRLTMRRGNAALNQWLIKYRGYKPLTTSRTPTPTRTTAPRIAVPRTLITPTRTPVRR